MSAFVTGQRLGTTILGLVEAASIIEPEIVRSSKEDSELSEDTQTLLLKHWHDPLVLV